MRYMSKTKTPDTRFLGKIPTALTSSLPFLFTISFLSEALSMQYI